MTNQEIHLHATKIAARYLKCEYELIEVIQKIDCKRIYLEQGHKSLHAYCVSVLKLSNDVAYYFIKVARKSTEVPELKLAIQSGALTVSQARQVASILSSQNAQELIIKAKTLSQIELQKEVAQINPKAAIHDRLKYISGSVLELRFAISEKVMKKFKRAKELECQKSQTHCDFEKVLEGVLDVYLEKLDPVVKAQRGQKRTAKKNLSQTKNANLTDDQASNFNKRRRFVPSQIRHQLNLRDQNQCTKLDQMGKRCAERKWLHVHHIKEVSKGGTHTLHNLTTLCFGHHRLHHFQ